MKLCSICNKEPAHSRGYCKRCYGIEYRKGRIDGTGQPLYHKEILFVKNYPNPKSLLYQAVVFKAEGKKYTPDFYDVEKNIFFEIVGTRQAFHENKNKLKIIKKAFPKIKFEIIDMISKHLNHKEINDSNL